LPSAALPSAALPSAALPSALAPGTPLPLGPHRGFETTVEVQPSARNLGSKPRRELVNVWTAPGETSRTASLAARPFPTRGGRREGAPLGPGVAPREGGPRWSVELSERTGERGVWPSRPPRVGGGRG